MENPFKEILGEDRPLRIFNVPWHVAHQYELYKMPYTEWFHCVNNVRKWGHYRPTLPNIKNVPYFEPGKYDIAVLHVDQQCVDPAIGKSKLYRELNDSVKGIPKIVIQHGTPFWPEIFTQEYLVMRMKQMVAGNHVVFNSHAASEMWGAIGASQTTIIHGMDPEEWFDLPKEPRIITSVSEAGLDKYYNRQLLEEVKTILRSRGVPHTWVPKEWKPKGFDDYRRFIGSSLIYFNPTLASPMPRSRTEAMLSGCCIVTLPNQDAETFIQHGVNGVHVPNNPIACADVLQALLYNYQAALQIGQAGRETALKLFHKDRFQADWAALIKRVMKNPV